jgi:hypothetical protein
MDWGDIRYYKWTGETCRITNGLERRAVLQMDLGRRAVLQMDWGDVPYYKWTWGDVPYYKWIGGDIVYILYNKVLQATAAERLVILLRIRQVRVRFSVRRPAILTKFVFFLILSRQMLEHCVTSTTGRAPLNKL